MRASSAGRLVVSALHTRDVASTVTALRGLHADARTLAANLAGIISQRLVPRPCPVCSVRSAPTEVETEMFIAEVVVRGLRTAQVRRFRNYLIFYLPVAGGIDVIPVLHAARLRSKGKELVRNRNAGQSGTKASRQWRSWLRPRAPVWRTVNKTINHGTVDADVRSRSSRRPAISATGGAPVLAQARTTGANGFGKSGSRQRSTTTICCSADEVTLVLRLRNSASASFEARSKTASASRVL